MKMSVMFGMMQSMRMMLSCRRSQEMRAEDTFSNSAHYVRG